MCMCVLGMTRELRRANVKQSALLEAAGRKVTKLIGHLHILGPIFPNRRRSDDAALMNALQFLGHLHSSFEEGLQVEKKGSTEGAGDALGEFQ